jgi:hypothetical protein
MPEPTSLRGLTPREAGRVLRKSPDWIRAMIQAGKLGALNLATGRGRKPRYIILPEHLAEFTRARRVVPQPAPTPVSRRKRIASGIDYYPD